MTTLIELLTQRTSSGRLQLPAPNKEQLASIIAAACRAPDHGRIKPWRFLAIEAQGLAALGELFAKALEVKGEHSAEKLADIAQKPLRAPMILCVIACVEEHAKVPFHEQRYSAACAANMALLAANALGFGGIWRTGPMASDAVVREGLHLAENEELIGFLYIGSKKDDRVIAPAEFDSASRLQVWP